MTSEKSDIVAPFTAIIEEHHAMSIDIKRLLQICKEKDACIESSELSVKKLRERLDKLQREDAATLAAKEKRIADLEAENLSLKDLARYVAHVFGDARSGSFQEIAAHKARAALGEEVDGG